MSRSYKKFPFCGGKSQFAKNHANRIIRHSKDVPNHKAYRKFFESWDIEDCYGIETYEEYKSHPYNLEKWHVERINGKRRYVYEPMTEKEIYFEWYKRYKMK